MQTITFQSSLPHAGAGLVPALNNVPTFFKYVEHCLWAGTRPAPAKRQ